MDKKDIPGFEETHSRLESLSIIDNTTAQDIQAFIDKDYDWATATRGNFAKVATSPGSDVSRRAENEPDWTPDC